MKPEIKAKWLEALRSGEYAQCDGGLSEDGAFCCLGVLCELALKEGIVNRTVTDNGDTLYDEEGAFLPEAVREWSGLKHLSPHVVRVDKELGRDTSLVCMNDEGTSFADIADVIEAQDDDWDGVIYEWEE